MTVAVVSGFGGGVVLEGGAESRRTDELQLCKNFDIGPRGALVMSPGVADYLTLTDSSGPIDQLLALRTVAGMNFVREIYVAAGTLGGGTIYLHGYPTRSGEASPYGTPGSFGAPYAGGGVPAARTEGVIVTIAQFPGVHKVVSGGGGGAATLVNVFLINIGAREGFAAGVAPGLHAVYTIPSLPTSLLAFAIDYFDALGTGQQGEHAYDNAGYQAVGASAKQLRFRGICAHKSYAIGWGHDQSDTTDYEGPTRVMFSNPAKPLKWGNDNVAAVVAATHRAFSDTDAVVIGDLGEIIRAGFSWNGRLWFGTNRQLHYMAGLGRDTWLVDGAQSVPRAENCIGAHALIEGPDRLLYGVSDQGLWAFDGGSFERHHKRLRNFRDMSPGWWDLIWTDRTKSDTYPGKTNQDLVWMAVDWDSEEVLVGIPWCDATAGYGYGTDTVLIKFKVRTGGFTQQIFAGVQMTAADFSRRQGQYPARKLFLEVTSVPTSKMRAYGEKTTPTTDIPNPPALPVVEIGEFALFGSSGSGASRTVYLTLSWASASALPIKLLLNWYLDGQNRHSTYLTVGSSAPGAPSEGDYWLDTSETDTNLGNATGTSLAPATFGYLLKVRWNSSWKIVAGGAPNSTQTRATVRLRVPSERLTRLYVKITTDTATGRFQIEHFGAKPVIAAEDSA